MSAIMGDIQVRRLPVLTATSVSSASSRWATCVVRAANGTGRIK